MYICIPQQCIFSLSTSSMNASDHETAGERKPDVDVLAHVHGSATRCERASRGFECIRRPSSCVGVFHIVRPL